MNFSVGKKHVLKDQKSIANHQEHISQMNDFSFSMYEKVEQSGVTWNFSYLRASISEA